MKPKSADDLYKGRTFPNGRSTAQERYPAGKGTIPKPTESPQPQTPANFHDEPRYSNDVPISSWLRNGDATTKPGFDHSQPRSGKRKG